MRSRSKGRHLGNATQAALLLATALLLFGCGPRGATTRRPPPPRPAPAASPAGHPAAGTPSCAACSGRPLQCHRSGAGGPGNARFARILGRDAVGCWGVGDPGLFDRDAQPFWFRCDLRQFCVERSHECYPANLTPTGFWLNIPGKNESLICGTR